MSGYAQPEDVERAIEAGFDGHIAKPCDPEKIRAVAVMARSLRVEWAHELRHRVLEPMRTVLRETAERLSARGTPRSDDCSAGGPPRTHWCHVGAMRVPAARESGA